MIEKSPFSNLDHIGVIVRDLDKATEYYQSLGIGPFEPVKVVATERQMRGKPIDANTVMVKARTAQLGPVKLELLQPVEGDIWREFLETRGEGINHIAFLVDDLDRAEAELEKQGLKIIYKTRFVNGGGDDYFDTGKVGGVLLSIIQWPSE